MKTVKRPDILHTFALMLVWLGILMTIVYFGSLTLAGAFVGSILGVILYKISSYPWWIGTIVGSCMGLAVAVYRLSHKTRV
ncbi:hypothetical protein A2264_00535 [candidate division WWE3 bacterium RIFOXYA2_FULL_46_9]|uniref:Uncharacterized protein n=1 Tax=candidate division WWE3 bacterium RIFOXYA2_FULL_46_9 TaxID=1802636 RepID=A0A1F4W1L2_UNCKA|nr:MAG: hypothetical protein A2264_00535 [candidate division WWE3 bacterium RIFOXYA2_FULL_46_9]OGC65248.1 MAG: hypothetical protein A2326_04170 [candidate division WWE3 bacterium RIFOXYB2_FULL_41_6]HLD51450.1 hypothetical protein [Patescibacteria group bacterium]